MSGKRGRKPGTPKTGGRQKGTPNRNSRTVKDALDALGVDLVAEVVEGIRQLSRKEQLPAWQALMAYVYPRLKEIEPPAAAPLPPPTGMPPLDSKDRSKVIRGSFAGQPASPA